MSWRPAYAIYSMLLYLLLPVLMLRLWWRGLREPGYRIRVAERFGCYAGPLPKGRFIWVHAVSLGETRAARPLIDGLLKTYPGHQIILTQMTASGLAAAQQIYGDCDRVHLAWLPYDYRFATRSFLGRYRPDLGIIMETEIWISLLHECKLRDIPVLLANGRLSQRSADRYRAIGVLMRPALACLAATAVQTDADAERFRQLGAHDIHVTGNLKFDAAFAQENWLLPDEFRRRFGTRRVVLAASLRQGEEALLIDALKSVGGFVGNALLVMVPRHPQRFDEVADLLAKANISFARRSAGAIVPTDCRVILGDSMGEMPAYLRACDCAFVGGSLLPFGGQNLIEACAAGVPVLFGPHTFNFAEASEAAVAAGAALRVANAEQLVREMNVLLSDDPRRAAMGKAALSFCSAHTGATAKTLDLCRGLLPVA